MNNKLVGLAALFSAGFASICCIGPLVITGLGIGSLGLATGLTQYRPLFLGLTAIVLGVGFHYAYRKRPVACADGTCEVRSGSRAMKDLAQRGTTGIPDRIRKGIAEGRCDCERKNPQGACCLGNVAAEIKRISKEVKSHA